MYSLKVYLLSSIYILSLQAEAELLAQSLDKEYAGIMGYENFRESAVAIAFGKEFSKVKQNLVSCGERKREKRLMYSLIQRVDRFSTDCTHIFSSHEQYSVMFSCCVQHVTAQTVSGTGSLRLAGMFLVSRIPFLSFTNAHTHAHTQAHARTFFL